MDWLLAQFGRQRPAAQRKYRAFVAEGTGQSSPWAHVQGQVLLGSERFVERLRPGLEDKHPFNEIPRQQRFAARPKLSHLFSARLRADPGRRHAVIRRANLDHGYSQSAIGRVLDVHCSTLSRIVNPLGR